MASVRCPLSMSLITRSITSHDSWNSSSTSIELEHFSLYLMDYGAPVGFRIAANQPERIETLIVQNGNAYVEGIDNDFWEPIQRILERSRRG